MLLLTFFCARTTTIAQPCVNGDDVALIRPSDINWLIDLDANQLFDGPGFQLGLPGDQFLAGEPLAIFGDNKDEIVVFRNGTWFVRQNTSVGGTPSFSSAAPAFTWGQAGDRAVVGAFFGGPDAGAVYRASASQFRVDSDRDLNPNSGSADLVFPWNPSPPMATQDRLLATDVFGQAGWADLVIWRGAPDTNQGIWCFYADGPATNAIYCVQFGLAGDLPFIADLNKDGHPDLCLVRPTPESHQLIVRYWQPGPQPYHVPNTFINIQPMINAAGGGTWNIGAVGINADNLGAPDTDHDGVCDAIDNCPNTFNPGQLDSDSDGVGDECDNCRFTFNPDQADVDMDGIGDVCDNCRFRRNTSQSDVDGDGIGDECDNCPSVPNANQLDTDIDPQTMAPRPDGIGDVCDNCPHFWNPNQEDSDHNNIGDICEPAFDCNHNGLLDYLEIAQNPGIDCNHNGIIDTCEPQDVRAWNAPSGGLFQLTSNWCPATSPPGPGDTALFNLGATYAVGFSANAACRDAVFRAGNSTLNLGSQVFSLSGINGQAASIADLAGTIASVSVSGGTLQSSGDIRVAGGPQSTGTLSVHGASTQLTSNADLRCGQNGVGLLTVDQGASVQTSRGFLGTTSGGEGNAVLSGAGTMWNAPLGIFVDHGSLAVRTQAQVSTLAGVQLNRDGRLVGDGTINGPVLNFGRTSPGAIGAGSVATLSIVGNFQQVGQIPFLGASSGSLDIEVPSASPGQFDQVAATGTATLGGGLFVTGPGAQTLAPGSTLQLVSASAGLIGQFDVAYLPGRSDGRFLRIGYQNNLVGGSVFLQVSSLSGSPNPQPPQGFNVDGQPVAAAVDDLNGDEFPDLVVAIPAGNQSNGAIVVLLNRGLGAGGWLGFADGTQYTVGRMPSAVSIGEVNGLAGKEIAVANKLDNTVSIFLNDGTGHFSLGRTVTTGAGPADADLVDVTGDGFADLLVTDQMDNDVFIAINVALPPNPLFRPIPRVPVGTMPCDLEPFDSDTDSYTHFAVANSGGSSVTIVRNLGAEVFATAQTLAVGAEPIAVHAVRLRGPGSPPDLVTVNHTGNSVSVLLNATPAGPGMAPVFSPAVDLPVGVAPASVAALDIDSDTDPDLAVVTTEQGQRVVRILRNDYTPDNQQVAFVSSQIVAQSPELPRIVLAADLDRDRRQDVLTINDTGLSLIPQPIRVRRNPNPCPPDVNLDGVLNSQDFFDYLVTFLTGTVGADFNSDGAVNSQDLFDFLSAFFAGCQ